MAKRSNSSRTKKLQASKPYDISNSFVKKVASRVTELFPQSIWPTKWFSSTNNEIFPRSDGRKALNSPHLLDKFDIAEQNVSPKRARIPLDSSLSDPLFDTSISSDFKGRRLRNSIITSSRDIEDGGAVAGPSGVCKKIPAGKLVTAKQKSRDNFCCNAGSLEVNGEGHSDSSESTSGCSSLPQMDSNMDARNSSQTTTDEIQVNFPEPVVTRANVKRRCIEGANYSSLATNSSHLLSSLEGFSSPSGAIPVGRRRNPSFNPDAFGPQSWSGEKTNIKDRIVNSPFYSGRTTYGGVSAYQNHRNDTQPSIGLKSIQIHPVKTSEARDGSVGMSNTARRILEALEMFSSPIQDAKKIPLSGNMSIKRRKVLSNLDASQSLLHSPSSTSLLSQETNSSHRLGDFLPPVRELIVPTVPDVLAMRRRQKLQGSTVAAREVANETSILPFNVEKVLENDSYAWADVRGSGGKIRSKNEINEESVEEPNLPNVALPITSLPKFDFLLSSSDSPSYTKTQMDFSKFKFSFPIAVSSASENLVTPNKFTFSSPLKASSKDSSGKNSPRTDFVSTNNSVQRSFKGSKSDKGLSVENVGEKNTEMENSERRCLENSTDKKLFGKDVCLQSMTQGNCNNLKLSLGNKFSEKSMFVEKFKSVTSSWKCETCVIQNNALVSQHFGSETCKNCSPKSDSSKIVKSSPETKSDFGDSFKPPIGSWSCEVCMINNPSDRNKCLACENPKTSKETVVTSVLEDTKASGFGDKFRKPDGAWDCTICLVRNKAGGPPKCVACEAPKPGSQSLAAVSESNSSTKISLGSSVDSEFNFGIDKAGNTAKKDSSVETQPTFAFLSSAPSTGFTFGIKPEGETKVSGFTFGISSTSESSEVDALKNSIVPQNSYKSILKSDETHETKPPSSELAKLQCEKEVKDDETKDFETKTSKDTDLKIGGVGGIPALTCIDVLVPSELKPVFSFSSTDEKSTNNSSSSDSPGMNGKWKLDGKPSNNNLTSSNPPIFGLSTTVASWNSKSPFKLDSSPKTNFFPQTSTSLLSANKNSDDKLEESSKAVSSTFKFGDISKHDSINSKSEEVPKTVSSNFKFQELPKTSSVNSLEEKIKTTSSIARSITSNPISSDSFSGSVFSNLNREKTIATSEKPNTVTVSPLSDSSTAGKASNSGPVFMFGSETSAPETAFNLIGQKQFTSADSATKDEPLKLFSNISATPNVFTSLSSAKATTFGSTTSSPSHTAIAASLPAAASETRNSSLFASPTSNPVFGSSVTSTVTFTSTSTTAAVSSASTAFGSSIFGSANQNFPTVSSSTVSFGSGSATSSAFGVGPSSVFGVNSTPPSAPFSFSGTAKPTTEEQSSQPISAPFVFGSSSTPSVQQPFTFSPPANKPAFSFGGSAQPGTSAAASALPSVPALSGFSFGDKGNTPFGSVQPATSIAGGTPNLFGSAPANITPAAASFGTPLGDTNTAVTAAFCTPTFNFGTSQSNPTFSFSNNQSTSLPTNISQPSGFNFGQVSQPNSAPQPVTFNPNVPPSFNFTRGTTPQFTATPGGLNVTSSANTMQRRFKKAVRRTQQPR